MQWLFGGTELPDVGLGKGGNRRIMEMIGGMVQ